MSEFEKFFEVKFPNIQATIDQSHCDESILLKKACRMTWNARQEEIDQLKAEKAGLEKRVNDALKITGGIIESKGNSVAISTCRGLCLDLDKTLRGEHE